MVLRSSEYDGWFYFYFVFPLLVEDKSKAEQTLLRILNDIIVLKPYDEFNDTLYAHTIYIIII